ncbi:MAG: hypothetical protein WC508_04330 [Patescibacteria group bacterium]
MKNIAKNSIVTGIFTLCFLIFSLILSAYPALASNPYGGSAGSQQYADEINKEKAANSGVGQVTAGLNKTANQAQISTTETNLPQMLGRAINYLFGALGAVFLTVILVGGYHWMTAGGDEEKVKKGKGWIINGINGMLVVFLAYALAYTFLFALKMAIGG